MGQLRVPAGVEGSPVAVRSGRAVRFWALLPLVLGAIPALTVRVPLAVRLFFLGIGVVLALLVLVMTQFGLYITQDERVVTRDLLLWRSVDLNALVSVKATSTRLGDHLWLADRTGNRCRVSMMNLNGLGRVAVARALGPYTLTPQVQAEGPVAAVFARYTG